MRSGVVAYCPVRGAGCWGSLEEVVSGWGEELA